MKRQEQIVKYLSKHHFDDADWKKVLTWCRSAFGGGNIHRSIKPVAESNFQTFMDWLEHGIGIGDVVVGDNFTGIVGNIKNDELVLSAYIDDNLCIKEKSVRLSDVRLADADTSHSFLQLLRDNGYVFSFSTCSCIKIWLPDDGDYVVARYGRKVRLGIFAGFTETGCAFYVTIEYNKCKFRQTIESQNIEFDKATKADSDKIDRLLASVGLIWNAEKKTFDNVLSKRAAKNHRYWYLSETFTIKADFDLSRKLDDARFSCGNYFLDSQEAYKFAQEVKLLRKQ